MEERKSDGASKSNPVSRDCLLRDKEQSPVDSGGKKKLESRLDGSLKIVCENRVDTPAGLYIHILMSQKEIGLNKPYANCFCKVRYCPRIVHRLQSNVYF
jgi:hypothetical protein